jgi:hypothetical protein
MKTKTIIVGDIAAKIIKETLQNRMADNSKTLRFYRENGVGRYKYVVDACKAENTVMQNIIHQLDKE